MIKATKSISNSILWIGLTPVLFLITFYLIPSLLVVQAQEMSTNIAFLTSYEPVTIVGNTPLTSQPLPANTSTTTISIVKGGADPNNEQFYVPKMVNVSVGATVKRSEEHTSELQSRSDLVCRLLLEKKKNKKKASQHLY